MKDTIKTLYTIIAVGFTLFAISYLLILALIFLAWLGGVM